MEDLPPPGGRYFELEAAFGCGYTLGEWHRASLVERAEVIAHYTERDLRKGWVEEQRLKKWRAEMGRKGRRGPQVDPTKAIMAQFGIG